MALLTSLAPGAHLDANPEPLFSAKQERRTVRGCPARDGLTLADAGIRAHSAVYPGTSAGAGRFRDSPDRRILLLLYAHRVGPASRNGRRWFHRRLHHAAGLLSAGNQSRDQSRGEHSAADPGSRQHFAPDRPATRSGHRYRSEPGRYQRQAKTDGAVLVEMAGHGWTKRADQGWRPGDRRCAREDHRGRARAGCRIPPTAAGHDRRSHQRSPARGDQTVFRRRGVVAPLGAGGGQRHQEDSRRGGRGRRHR